MFIFNKKEASQSQSGFILPYILLITFLITSAIIYLLGITYFSNYNTQKVINRKKLELACYSAVLECVVQTGGTAEAEYLTIFDSIPVKIVRRMKGLFVEFTATAANSIDSAKVIFLAGEKLSQPFNNAILISRPYLNISHAGRNRIRGSILSGTPKISPGTIYGLEVISERFIDATVIVSDSIKPKLFSELLLESNQITLKKDDFINVGRDLILDKECYAKFKDGRKYFVEGDLFIKGMISEKYLSSTFIFIVSGKTVFEKNTNTNLNLEIYSDSTIVFEGYSSIENLLVHSKENINVFPGCTFKNTQLFTEANLNVVSSVFEYPSILLVYTRAAGANKLNSILSIEGSRVNGTLMLVSSFAGLESNQSLIKIDKNSKINGLVYSENNTEIHGEITGSVYTYNFYFYKEPSVYINWLVNLNINREGLDESFLIPCGFSEKPDLEIMSERWIY